MPIWNPRMECMVRADLEQLQLERLQAVVNRVWEGVPWYRRRLEELELMPEHIRSLEDLRLLPFTEREDLRRGYPYDMFAVPLREVVRIHFSPGAQGPPTVSASTKNDLRHWRELAARVLSAGGMSKDDVVQISFGQGLLSDAFGLYQGAEEIGASVVPVSAGAMEQQLNIMLDFRTTALVGTPSYALQLGEALEERGLPKSGLHLRWGMLGGEPWTEEARGVIEAKLGISATDNYRVSELMGPGISGECEEHKAGLHLNEDHFLCEVVDPETGEPLPAGETGELVVTTLTREALPVIRYRTRDLTSLHVEPCPCGRTTARMNRVFRRTDDMMIVGGVKVFPSQLEAVLLAAEGVGPQYQVILERVGGADRLEVQVEVSSALLTGDVRHLLATEGRLRRQLAEALGVAVEVRFVEARSITRGPEGGRRVIDRRASEGGDAPARRDAGPEA